MASQGNPVDICRFTGDTVVKYSTQNSEIEDMNPASGTRREKMVEKI